MYEEKAVKSVRVLVEQLNKAIDEQAAGIGELFEELEWVLLPSVPEQEDERKNPDVPEPELVQLLMDIISRVGNNTKKLRNIIGRLTV